MAVEPGALSFLTVNDLKESNINVFKREYMEALFRKQGNPLAIDMKLGDEVFISTNEVPFRLETSDHPSDSVTIKPGEFALLTTWEELTLPDDVFALISMRFSYKIKGLINVSGFHVDPGYNGRIIYSVYNAGPNSVALRKEDSVFTIIFAKLARKSNRENKHFDKIERISLGHIAGLVGAPVSLERIHERVRTLEVWNKITIGVMSGLVIAVLAAILGLYRP